MIEPVIISAVRTPVGRYMGTLREVEAYDLASLVLIEALRRAGIQSNQAEIVVAGGVESMSICGGGGLGIAAVFERI